MVIVMNEYEIDLVKRKGPTTYRVEVKVRSYNEEDAQEYAKDCLNVNGWKVECVCRVDNC